MYCGGTAPKTRALDFGSSPKELIQMKGSNDMFEGYKQLTF
jgi:hypothetical protein